VRHVPEGDLKWNSHTVSPFNGKPLFIKLYHASAGLPILVLQEQQFSITRPGTASFVIFLLKKHHEHNYRIVFSGSMHLNMINLMPECGPAEFQGARTFF
jgi:hypothetical protein